MIKKIGIIAIMLSISFAANAQKFGFITQFGWAFGIHDVAKGTDGKLETGFASRFGLLGNFELDSWGTWRIIPKISYSEEAYSLERNFQEETTIYDVWIQGWEQATNVRYILPNEMLAIEAGYYVNYIFKSPMIVPDQDWGENSNLGDDTFWSTETKFNQYEFGINLAFGINDVMIMLPSLESIGIKNMDIMYTTSIGFTNYAKDYDFKRFQMGVMISIYFGDGY
jgi:hypothetical protein